MATPGLLQRLRLTTRLTILYGLVSAAALCGLGWVMLTAVQAHFIELDDAALHEKLYAIETLMADTDLARLPAQLGVAFAGYGDLDAEVRDAGGQLLFATATVAAAAPDVTPGASDSTGPRTAPAAGATPAAGSAHARHATEAGASGTLYRTLHARIAGPAPARAPLEVRLRLDTARHAHFYRDLQRLTWVYVALVTLVSGLLGWWVARTGLTPLRLMKARAQAVGAQSLGERMPVAAVPIELADLAHSLNDMLDRLQRDFTRLSEFSSDLAHELRTPLSNLLTQTQVALTQPRSADDYRDILASNAEEFQRLARMVADMLLLAKADHGLLLPTREPIELADEARALCEFYEALAADRQLALEVSGQARVTGDRLMLRRALSNLLANALRYAPAGSTVRITLSGTAGTATVGVENRGPAIDAALLPRLFDRFVRADRARQHDDDHDGDGGTGLGLAIVRAIATAHGGSASVTSAADCTRFMLHLPAAGTAAPGER